MSWRADCDDCAVVTPTDTEKDRRILIEYLRGGPPNAKRAESLGLILLPCSLHGASGIPLGPTRTGA